MPGDAFRVAVAPDGNPWVINKENILYYWNQNGWTQVQGSVADVAIGADGSAWIAGTGKGDLTFWDKASPKATAFPSVPAAGVALLPPNT